jgi:hypothetical protein
VRNNGDLAGDYEVTLYIDDTAVEMKPVTLPGHSSQTVSFSTTPADGTRSVKIGDLTGTITVVAPQSTGTVAALPDLTVSDIKVTPDRPNEGEPLVISAVVKNNTDKALSQDIVLKINGITTSSQVVELAANASQPVTFKISKETAGFYIARIGDSTVNFVVSAKPAGVRWPLIIIVLCALAVVGAVLYFKVFARKSD